MTAHQAGDSGALRPTGVDDLSQGGFATKELVRFVDEKRRMQAIDDVIDVCAGQLDRGIRPRHQEADTPSNVDLPLSGSALVTIAKGSAPQSRGSMQTSPIGSSRSRNRRA